MDERESLLHRIDVLEAASERMRLDASMEALMSLPLTVQQLKATVVVITGNGDTTVQRLAEVLQVSLATVSGIVDRLVGHGVVERVTDERDRRSRRLVATDRGREIIHSLMVEADGFRRAAMARLELEDLRALVQGMEALMRVAFTPEGAAPDREEGPA